MSRSTSSLWLAIVLMAMRFAKSYVDRLFAERNLDSLHHLISVVGRERELPEESWLFCRVFEWAPARSGVWQYYEALSDGEFKHISQALDRFGLVEIAEKYRLGKRTWNGPEQAAGLDGWLDAHTEEVHESVFRLIAVRKGCLIIDEPARKQGNNGKEA